MRRVGVLGLCLAVAFGAMLPWAAIAAPGEQDEELTAFGILDELAAQGKAARITSGYTQIGLGVVLGAIVGVVVHAVAPDLALPAGIVAGALGVVPGIITLNRPGPPELALARVVTYPVDQRERRSVIALHKLADEARERRVLQAIVYGASGLAGFAVSPLLATQSTYYWGFYNLGMAAYSLWFPSREERALTLYLSLTSPTQPEGGTEGQRGLRLLATLGN